MYSCYYVTVYGHVLYRNQPSKLFANALCIPYRLCYDKILDIFANTQHLKMSRDRELFRIRDEMSEKFSCESNQLSESVPCTVHISRYTMLNGYVYM